ncbi:MAG: HypC/HybG/HupF family hydrogenase formation chaperone [Promethearchaeia archaeon]
MCLAIPGKIVELNKEEHSAIVDFDGIKQKVIVAMVPNPEVGKYVVIHAGYAIEIMGEEDAMEAINQWKEIAEDQDMDITDIM